MSNRRNAQQTSSLNLQVTLRNAVVQCRVNLHMTYDACLVAATRSSAVISSEKPMVPLPSRSSTRNTMSDRRAPVVMAGKKARNCWLVTCQYFILFYTIMQSAAADLSLVLLEEPAQHGDRLLLLLPRPVHQEHPIFPDITTH